jgi:hypothetical protein
VIAQNQVAKSHLTLAQLIQLIQGVKDSGIANGIKVAVKMYVATRHFTLIMINVITMMMVVLLMEMIMVRLLMKIIKMMSTSIQLPNSSSNISVALMMILMMDLTNGNSM